MGMDKIPTNNHSAEPERLQDFSTSGRERPWNRKKMKGLLVADSFSRMDARRHGRRSERMYACGAWLEFTEFASGRKRLTSATFCRERMCPMCQWRRSLKNFCELSRVMDEVETRDPELVPLFLTLTVKNCQATALQDTIKLLLKGWDGLLKIRKIKRLVAGWFRALEVTYNKQQSEFHPHLHAVLYVPRSYFSKQFDDYMETDEWAAIWRDAARLDYDPIVDVRKAYKTRDKAVSELAKYAVKDTEFAPAEPNLRDFLVGSLFEGLHRVRLMAYGGLMKGIAKEETEETQDLIHVGDEEETVRGDIAKVVRSYGFHIGFRQYVLLSKESENG